MSFIEQDDILDVTERFMKHLLENVSPNRNDTSKSFPLNTWDYLMDNYGSDKPELRTTEF
jgi:aspartyl-tRNA synthetase